MGFDDGDGHEVEDAAGVGVFGVDEVFVTACGGVGGADVFGDLVAVGFFEVVDVVGVGLDDVADLGVFTFEVDNLADEEGFSIGDGVFGADVVDDVGDGGAGGGGGGSGAATVGADFEGAYGVVDFPLILNGGAGHLHLANLFHEFGDATGFDEAGANQVGEGDELANVFGVGEEAGKEVVGFDQAGKKINVGFAIIQGGEMGLEAGAKLVDGGLKLGVGGGGENLGELGGVGLGEEVFGEEVLIELVNKLGVGGKRFEGGAFAVFDEGFEDGVGVVGEIHNDDFAFGFVAAVEAGDGLDGVAVDDGFIEKHASEEGLVEAGLEFVGDDHEAVVIAFEAVFNLFAGEKLVDGVFGDGLVGFGVGEVGEGVEDFVIRIAFFEFFANDVVVAQACDTGGGDDHGFGAAIDEGFDIFFEDAEHDFGFVLDEAFILEGDILEGFGDDAFGVEAFFFGGGNDGAVKVVEGFV